MDDVYNVYSIARHTFQRRRWCMSACRGAGFWGWVLVLCVRLGCMAPLWPNSRAQANLCDTGHCILDLATLFLWLMLTP